MVRWETVLGALSDEYGVEPGEPRLVLGILLRAAWDGDGRFLEGRAARVMASRVGVPVSALELLSERLAA